MRTKSRINPFPALAGAMLALSTTLLTSISAHAATAYIEKSITVPHRMVPVRLDIYFPAREGQDTKQHGSNVVFEGIKISAGQQPLPGRHPVVLFSHGSGGNGINTGWFARALADEGMIVISPNHPGSTSRDSDPEQSLKTWERPLDFSSIIDQLPQILPAGLEADMSRIGATGFSLGGYTALALGGARLSKVEFVTYCARPRFKGLNECGWFTKDGFDLNDIDRKGFEQDNFEPRISAIVSIDPGFAAAYTPESLSMMERPVKIINLGSAGTVPAGVDAAQFSTLIPEGEYHAVEEAWHFSFLGTCTRLGPVFLALTFDDPICSEYGNRERSDIHSEVARETAGFLKHYLAPVN